MTSLERLLLRNLSSMVEVPAGIEFLLPLQTLGFAEMTRDFVTLLSDSPGLAGQYVLRD